jgi:hypothetical protein
MVGSADGAEGCAPTDVIESSMRSFAVSDVEAPKAHMKPLDRSAAIPSLLRAATTPSRPLLPWEKKPAGRRIEAFSTSEATPRFGDGRPRPRSGRP